jgi:soluble cytochrome b562
MNIQGCNGDEEASRASILHKTKMCKFYQAGMCQRGVMCGFAHSEQELHVAPDLSRTKLCPALISGNKCQNPHCRYAHRNCEVRHLDLADKQNTPVPDVSVSKENPPPAKQSPVLPAQRHYDTSPTYVSSPVIPMCSPDLSVLMQKGVGSFGNLPLGTSPGPRKNYDCNLGLKPGLIISQERGNSADSLIDHADNLLGALQHMQDKGNMQEALYSAHELLNIVNVYVQNLEDKIQVNRYKDIPRAPPQGHWNGSANNPIRQYNPDLSLITQTGAGRLGNLPVGSSSVPHKNHNCKMALKPGPVHSQQQGNSANSLIDHADNLWNALQHMQDKGNVQEALYSAHELLNIVNVHVQNLEDKTQVDRYQDIGRAPPQGHWKGSANNLSQQFSPKTNQQSSVGKQSNNGIPHMDLSKLRSTLFKFMEEVEVAQQQQSGAYNNFPPNHDRWSRHTIDNTHSHLMQSWDERALGGSGIPNTPPTADKDGCPKEGCDLARHRSWGTSNPSDNIQRDQENLMPSYAQTRQMSNTCITRGGFVQTLGVGLPHNCADDSGNYYSNINEFVPEAAQSPRNNVHTDGFSRQTSPCHNQGTFTCFSRQTSPCQNQGTFTSGSLPDYPASCHNQGTFTCFSRQTSPCHNQGTFTSGSLPDYPASDFASCYGGFSRQTTLQQYEPVSQSMSKEFLDDELVTECAQAGFSRRTSPFASYAQHEDADDEVKGGVSGANVFRSSSISTHDSFPDGDSTSWGCGSFSRQSTPHIAQGARDEDEEINTDNVVAEWSRQQSPFQTTDGHSLMSRQTSIISELQQGDVQGCTKALSEMSSSLGLRLSVKSTFLDCDPLSDDDITDSKPVKRSASFPVLSRLDVMVEEEIEDIDMVFERQVTC